MKAQLNRPPCEMTERPRPRPEGARGRQQRRLRPVLLALEDRTLLASFTVSNTNDSAAGSLRQAIIDANSASGADTIVFSSLFNTPQTITLTSGQLNVTDDLTITGPGAKNLTVSGNNASRVFELSAGGTHNFTFSGLTIANGSSDFGGGMDFGFTNGTLTIQSCVFSGNNASQVGGGLQVFGNGTSATIVNISNTTFTNNHAGFGGTADLANTTATLSNCTISGNSASVEFGGLTVLASNSGETAAATLTNCTIAGNSGPLADGLAAFSQGGAVSATAQYANTIFANNPSQNVGAYGPGTSVTSLGHNISDDGTGNLTGPGDQPNTNPLLAPLGNYGGPTPTMALLPGSPAIGGGDSTQAPATDQRGLPRFGPTDVGAFEYQFKVTNTSDAGTGSLRQAIANANSTPGADTVVFLPTVTGTITLTTGQLELSNTSGTETITGPAAGVTVSGGGASRVFQVDGGVTADLSGLTISGGSTTLHGGGLYNTGTTTLTDCTLSGNKASILGGAIFTNGPNLSLSDCTLALNTAGVSGGAIDAQGPVTVTSSTFSANIATSGGGGGIDNYGNGFSVKIGDSILAGNSCGFGPDFSNGVVSLGHNLVGETDDSSGWVSSDLTGTIAQPLNPLLAPLGNYGGPTQTMALLPGSPAINAGTSTGAPTTDQRGQPRVGAVDIGAFESQGFTLAPVAGSTPQSTVANTAFANPLAVSVTANNPVEPVNGGVITFAAPVTGASATLSATTPTIAGGQASVTATADTTLGAYTVTASAAGAGSATFNLTNIEAPSLVVTTTSDVVDNTDGLTSLREAIAYAGTLPGTKTITFSPSVFSTHQTITLTLGELALSQVGAANAITIMAPAVGVTLNGNNTSRVFDIAANVTASLSGLTITGGSTSGSGGGLFNNGGTVTLTNCTLSGNSASSGSLQSGGGGLFNNGGTVTLTDCTLTDNAATGFDGGGLFNSGGTATLTNCTIGGNSAKLGGGGLENEFGMITLANCTVSGNSTGASGGGGGLDNFGGTGTATLTNCTVNSNSAGDGGGLFNTGMVTLTSCTISGNSATSNQFGGGGGGLDNFGGTATLTNCTLSSNSTNSAGGGLFNTTSILSFGTATLISCTVSGNSGTLTAASGGGGGLFNNDTMVLTNTIVAGNTKSGGSASDVGEPGTGSLSGSYNLIGTGGSGGLINGVDNNQVGVANPLLGSLGNYGGPTQTIPLLPGSPAINAGTSSGAPTTDQRGLPRVGATDIGAFEAQGFTITITNGDGQSAVRGTSFAEPLAVAIAPLHAGDPVDGGQVQFTPPASGPGRIDMFAPPSPVTIASATADTTVTADSSLGSYVVTASTAGATAP